MRFLLLRSIAYSLLVHLLIGGLLVFNFNYSTPARIVPPPPSETIIEATTVDTVAVEKELQRLKDIDRQEQQQQQKKQRALEKKLSDLQKKSQQASQQRKQEQKKLAELKKQDAALAEQRKKEELIWQQKEEAESQRKKEEEQRRQAEAKRLQQEKIRKEKEAAEKKRKAEELRKKQAEEALKKQLAAERAAEQRRQDKKTMQNVVGNIYRKVNNNFNKTGLPGGLECVLSVQTVPGGQIIAVKIDRSSGNEIFDRRAITAVEKSSPLPLPKNEETFNRLKLRSFNFRFKPEE
ncbi:MAG: cell envelope integrity protein TolA [Gammaproteobacteria bacterium]